MLLGRIGLAALSMSFFAPARGALSLRAADCNENGVPDALDIRPRCRFSAPASYPCGPEPACIKAEDLDGDGDIDLVVRKQSFEDVCVFLNQGDGTFAATENPPAGSGANCHFWDVVADVDGDGDLDFALLDPEAGRISVFLWEEIVGPPASEDLNADGIPDECEAVFLRGDCNGDGQVTGSVTDAVFWLTFNFVGGREPPCMAACDTGGLGAFGTVTPAVLLLNFNFLGGPAPPAPFPGCGLGDGEDFTLGCKTPPAYCGARG